MNKYTIQLPIFPLDVFLLPEGITRLKIFEPRYLRMISIASKEQGFVIWLNNEMKLDNHINWGSWVKIINFNQDENGILEVDVQCKALVELKTIHTDKDNLHHGSVELLDHWSMNKTESLNDNLPVEELSNSLIAFFNSTSVLSELYQDIPEKNASWVIARWLELLPLELIAKNNFIDKYGFSEAKAFIKSIILK
jgi:Lon protease-like protein